MYRVSVYTLLLFNRLLEIKFIGISRAWVIENTYDGLSSRESSWEFEKRVRIFS